MCPDIGTKHIQTTNMEYKEAMSINLDRFKEHIDYNMPEWFSRAKERTQKMTRRIAKMAAQEWGVADEDLLEAVDFYHKAFHKKEAVILINVTHDSHWTVRFIDNTHVGMHYFIEGNQMPGPEAVYHIAQLQDNEQYARIKSFLKA